MLRARAFVAAVLAGATLLAGCDMPVPDSGPPGTAPSPRPARPAPEPSAESLELAAYYQSVQRGLLIRGLLRTDGGGPDTPYSANDLARNFSRIALYQEYADVNGYQVAQETATPLQRWRDPVNLSLEFGATVSPETRRRTRAEVGKYALRLARVTGHPIRAVTGTGGGNFHILVLNEPERQAVGSRLRQLMPGISAASLAAFNKIPRETYCLVFTTSEGGLNTRRAVAIIRGELPGTMRTACLHEEIAQGLGLPNDSPRARPSIFNDDEEFGLLTSHDELLLKMLYDPRLAPGMTETEARPIVNQIALELTGGGSV